MAAQSPFFSNLETFRNDLAGFDHRQQQRQERRRRQAIERRRDFADLVPYWFDEFQDFYHSDSEQSAEDALRLPPHFSVAVDADEFSDASDLIESAGGVLDRENRVNFVRNLFQDRVEQQERGREMMSRSGFGVIDDESRYLHFDSGIDLGLGFNFGYENGDFVVREVEEEDDDDDDDDDDVFFGGWRMDGGESMRVFGSRLGSEEAHRDLDHSDLCPEEEDEFHMEYGDTLDDVSEALCWDSLQLEDHSQTEANEELEWEEIADADEELERRVLSMAFGVEVDDVVESVLQLQNDEVVPERVVTGWEVLLNAENVGGGGNVELGNEDLYVGPEGYFYADEYETVFGQFADNDSVAIGKSPAAKASVENLATAIVTQVDVETNASLCAVCKDDMHVGEKAKKLPCSHNYHENCIIPWLAIRNTCPVCRFELPTDDPDYERRRTLSASTGN